MPVVTPHTVRARAALVMTCLTASLTLTHAAQGQSRVPADDERPYIAHEEPAGPPGILASTDDDTFASPVVELDWSNMPGAAFDTLDAMNVRGADLRDVLRTLGAEHDLNLVVDDAIEHRVTLQLTRLPVLEALRLLCEEHGLDLIQRGTVFRIRMPDRLPKPPHVVSASIAGDLLTVDAQGEDVREVARRLTEVAGVTVVATQHARGPVRGFIKDVPLKDGLRSLFETNGFRLQHEDGVYRVEPAHHASGRDDLHEAGAFDRFYIDVRDGRVTLDVARAGRADVLRALADEADSTSFVTYLEPEGEVTARVKNVTVEQALDYLFRGTGVTYRRHGNVFFIGSKETSGIATTRLLRLGHIKAEAAAELIPETLLARATVEVVREHNGLMVTGPRDVIAEYEAFVTEIDYPTPQILIEALVVDFEATDLFELGATFGQDASAAKEHHADGLYRWGEGPGQSGGFEMKGDGSDANWYLEHLEGMGIVNDLLGARNIGRLPKSFYFRLHALAQEGKAEIRSRPQIATLNGHAASLVIGTTQYYILKETVPITSPNQVVVRESERFEKIEANVKLEIVPWVSESGVVTTEIRPEFSTPVGTFNPEVPPTINSRVLESTVRLKDGETIVLGGLIQDSDYVSYNKVPVLGSIPLLGHLFRNRRTERRKSELVIYLTPHVFYGDERDEDRWSELRDHLDLTDPDATGQIGYTRTRR